MMRQLIRHDVLRLTLGLFALLLAAAAAYATPLGNNGAAKLYAVVPKVVIYPGEVITPEQLRVVEVTNPNLAGDYTQEIRQVQGMVTKKTLLPDRAIYVSDLREPYAVSRGTQVRMVYDNGNLQITALGIPLEDGSIGDLVRVRNADSGLTVTGTILAAGVVRVVEK